MHSYSTYRKQAQKQVPKYRRANYWNSVIYSTISELSKYPTELRNSIFKDLQLLWPLSEKINGVLLPPALGRRGKNLRVGRPEKPRPQVPRGSVSSLGFTSIGSEFTRLEKRQDPSTHFWIMTNQAGWQLEQSWATSCVLNTSASMQVGHLKRMRGQVFTADGKPKAAPPACDSTYSRLDDQDNCPLEGLPSVSWQGGQSAQESDQLQHKHYLR